MVRARLRSSSLRRLRFVACGFGTAALAGVACGGVSDNDLFETDSSGGSSGSGGVAGASNTHTSGGAGNSTSSASSGTTGSAGSAGVAGTAGTGTTTTGSGGTESTSSSGGSSNGGTTSTGATTGGLPSRCELPIEPGPCDGSQTVYGFNAELGHCEVFIYGGCEGNDNRFPTLDDCIETCHPGGRQACESSADCVVDQSCCGYCGIDDVEQLEAVYHAYAGYNDPACMAIDCDYCAPPQDYQHFGAHCDSGSCELYDVRESDWSSCSRHDECVLRAGLDCCESCSNDGSDGWVAVSASFDEHLEELCGDEVACDPCVAVPPESLTAVCGESGHCTIGRRR